MVAISIVLSYNVESMIRHVSDNTSIVVFIKKDTTSEQLEQTKKDIERLENVASVTFKSKKNMLKRPKI